MCVPTVPDLGRMEQIKKKLNTLKEEREAAVEKAEEAEAQKKEAEERADVVST